MNETKKKELCGSSTNQLAVVRFRHPMHRIWKHVFLNNRYRHRTMKQLLTINKAVVGLIFIRRMITFKLFSSMDLTFQFCRPKRNVSKINWKMGNVGKKRNIFFNQSKVIAKNLARKYLYTYYETI